MKLVYTNYNIIWIVILICVLCILYCDSLNHRTTDARKSRFQTTKITDMYYYKH